MIYLDLATGRTICQAGAERNNCLLNMFVVAIVQGSLSNLDADAARNGEKTNAALGLNP